MLQYTLMKILLKITDEGAFTVKGAKVVVKCNVIQLSNAAIKCNVM
jgi:hypothetical protein